MPPSEACSTSRREMDTIRTLQARFVLAHTQASQTQSEVDILAARTLKLSLESKILALQETLYPVEAERRFNLRAQYEAQLTVLQKSNFLETDANGRKFILAVDGHPYPIPTYDTLLANLVEQRETLGTKAEQHFTKLVLVPFGLSLTTQFTKFRAYLKAYKSTHPTFGRLDPALKDDSDKPTWDPLYSWDQLTEANLVYYPQSFDEHHGGQTKAELLAAEDKAKTAGWHTLFLQTDDANKPLSKQGIRAIPRAGQGQTDGEGDNQRRNLEAGQSPNTDLAKHLKEQAHAESPYKGESSLTPEDWLAMFITHLEATGELLDNYGNPNKQESLANLTGAYVPGSGNVPYAFWDRDARRVFVNGSGPAFSGGDSGSRAAVRV